MVNGSGVKVIRLHRFAGDSKTKAFVDVGIGDFVVKGLRVVEGKSGLFLAMPREKSKDGKWYDSFYAANNQAKESLSKLVLDLYQQ